MIGYYAHHQGSGHLQRAAAVSRQVGTGLTVLSSTKPPADIPYLSLARDDVETVVGDVTAAGALHWAPLRHQGLRERSNQILAWAARTDCNLLVSDVSVEVLLLARLLSIPSVAVALRGERLDRPHALGYDVASRIIAPWPRYTQGDELQQWLHKTVWVGAVSRFDGRVREIGRCDRPGRCAVVLLGRGGNSMTARDLREAAAVPGVHWHLLGSPVRSSARSGTADLESSVEPVGWVADPWPLLCRADVVVAAAGDAAIADVAAAGRPLIAVPQARPYGEQHANAAALVRHRLCVAAPTWPDRRSWPRLLDQAEELGGWRWEEYRDGQGTARMANALVDLAEGDSDDPDPRADQEGGPLHSWPQMLRTAG